MQPYLFPYLGYYQLVHHVSEFVFFDDVNFIKRGYIARNHILCDGASRRFTLPIHRASQNRLIKDHVFLDDASAVTNLIEYAYRRAPHFSAVYPLICAVLNDPNRSVANITACSIRCVFAYLGLEKRFSFSSDISKPQLAKGEEKIIEICVAKRARQYTNAIGGKELYHADAFASRGITLQFIRMNDINYSQLSPCYVRNLSIIDILMNCPKEQVKSLLAEYSIELAPNSLPTARQAQIAQAVGSETAACEVTDEDFGRLGSSRTYPTAASVRHRLGVTSRSISDAIDTSVDR